jgi:hypothetical protein
LPTWNRLSLGTGPKTPQLRILAWKLGPSNECEPATPNRRGFSTIPFQDFIFILLGSGVVSQQGDIAALRHFVQESAMKLLFGIAIMFLGVAAAHGQTALQPSGQTNGSGSTAASGPLSVPTSSLPSGSSSSSGTGSGSAGGAGGTGSQAPLVLPGEMTTSGASQSSQQLPGETPETATQAARTTASAPAASSPTCVSVPSTDGGSANLTEIAGAALDGC